jgi:hypothetical protein
LERRAGKHEKSERQILKHGKMGEQSAAAEILDPEHALMINRHILVSRL